MKLTSRFLSCLFVISSFAVRAENMAQVVGQGWEFKDILLDDNVKLVEPVVEYEITKEVKQEIKSDKNMISKNLLISCMNACSDIAEKNKNITNKTGEDMATKDALKVDKKISKDEGDVFVQKRILPNGMTVLVREVHNTPKVSVQVFYKVGSKDEKTGEKGIAHLIEHMIFKGSQKLSETDIIATVHKLSGSSNAFTSYDYTGYLFDLPTQHWKEALPIMAECMENCSFNDDHLNSEMKAVIQEMKMLKDNYMRHLIFEMLTLIFPDHPYHYPLIGHKQDLWSVRGADLRAFYKKHYLPNNAVLIVVGDVEAKDVFENAEKYFGKIPANLQYRKEKFYNNKDIASKTMTLYRDIQQPSMVLSFVVPGACEKNDPILDAAELILGKGKGSRLYSKLVDQMKLVSSISADSFRLFDHGIFFIFYEPKNLKNIQKIEEIILQEIDSIIKDGVTEQEIERAVKQTKMDYYSKLENVESQAYDIGKTFLAVGDENYPFTFLDGFDDNLSDKLKDFFAKYIRKSVMHKGSILPLEESEKKEWKDLQEQSDQEDKNILYGRVRETALEGPKYANNIQIKEPNKFDFPKAQTFGLSNGIKVLYYDNKNTPKINLRLELKAKYFYDPANMQGLYNFLADAMTEGTKNYTAVQLANEIEQRGMSLSVSPGMISMSMLSSDLPKALEILEEVLSRPALESKEVEKVREQILIDIKNFWDDPASIASQLVKEAIYKDHPYGKNFLGTKDSINSIKTKDLKNFYKENISPVGAKLSIVGDLSKYDLKKVLEEKLAKWAGPEVKEIIFPKLSPAVAGDNNYYINRDQVVLSFANLSIDRKHKDYDKFLLFDQIFGGGVLGSMSSRLFHLREETGLFYTIAGTSIANADQEPGIAVVRTIVSLDKLKDAETLIKQTIDKTADSITDEEFDLAKRAIANSLSKNFETNSKIAKAFLFLDKYNLPSDYFDNRAEQLSKVTLVEVKSAVKSIMKSEDMLTLRVGRVGEASGTPAIKVLG